MTSLVLIIALVFFAFHTNNISSSGFPREYCP